MNGEKDMAEHIRIYPAAGTWVVRVGGAVMGESTTALELREGDYPPVIYFPRDDIAMALLDRTEKVTHCPHKGDAAHFSIVTRSAVLENAAWSYEEPLEAMDAIRGHVAFYNRDEVTVEKL